MSVNSRKGPIVDPGLCRCCGSLKKCRILNVEYDWMGQTEIYSEMFVDCFGLVLSHLDGLESERLICATCVVRLREARAFRTQVLRCEENLLMAALHVHQVGETRDTEKSMKQEPDETVHDDDYVTDDDAPLSEKLLTKDEVKVEVPPRPERHEKRNKQIVAKVKRLKTEQNPVRYDKVEVPPRQQRLEKRSNKLVHEVKRINTQRNPLTYEPKLHYLRKPATVDKDLNALKNAVTIVENSYVCPFTAVFSDYFCVYCKEMFLDPDKLREHTLTHDPRTYEKIVDSKKLIQIDVDRIDCRLCDEKIDNLDTFKDHITKIHGKVLYRVDNEFLKFKLRTGTVNCYECQESFGFFHALKKHMAQHYGTFICDVCGSHYFEERLLIQHKKTHSFKKDILYSCNECEKSFKSKTSLYVHISRIHRNEPAYPCNKCDEMFISYHLRYRHKMEVHGEKRTFPCEGCDKVYESRKSLRDHNQRTHLQLLRHECNICDKKFYLPSGLRDHMTSHTGERNYRCEFCGKKYPRAKALKVHIQSHSTEKRYKCSLCPSAYTQITNYKNHMKSKHPMNLEEYI